MLTEIMAVLEGDGSNEDKARAILSAVTRVCEPAAWFNPRLNTAFMANAWNAEQTVDGYLQGRYQPLYFAAPVRTHQLESVLLWVLYHHQGGASHIGQTIRKALGIGAYDPLTPAQIERGKAAALYAVTESDHAQSHRSCACDGLSYKEA